MTSPAIVCGADGIQRLIMQRDGWWVIEDRTTRECLSGGYLTRTAAIEAAQTLGRERSVT